jgi:transcriptional regulator GlxA family with amidase domain
MFLTRDGARNRLRLRDHQVASLRPLLERMVREYDLALLGHGAMLLGHTVELVTRLCRFFSEATVTSDSSVGRLARVASLIETEFSSPLSLDDLADVANLSRNHVIRLFTETYRVTPMRRLIQVRLEHAKWLLSSTDSSIAEIAAACGFPDANYFARLFKRHEGCRPSQFRAGEGATIR